jgi:gamma-glutamyltranspeptidase/glutathione hydrolase
MLILREFGTMNLRAVLQPAMDYAEEGHPLLAAVSSYLIGLADYLREHWPSSAATWLPGGQIPEANEMFRNPVLAATYRKLIKIAESAGGDRIDQIEAARVGWREGFVADAIFNYLKDAEVTRRVSAIGRC